MTRILVLAVLVAALWRAAPALSQALVQTEGAPHKGPYAYHDMCRREPGLCRGDQAAGRSPGAGPVARLSRHRRRLLRRTNARINAQIRAGRDIELYGVSDYWTAGGRFGDCEDYIVAKKQALIAAGWAADQLLYAVVVGTETPYHAVLVVRTDRGDLVLDNLRPEILDWRASGYSFVVRQSAADPRRWVRIQGPETWLARRGN